MAFIKKRPFLALCVALLTIVFVVSAISYANKPSGSYMGRVFVAGHGGHIADANVVIDPLDNENPIKIPNYTLWTGNKLHMIPLGPASDHAVHDVRLDSRDRNIAFWSTYLAPKPYVIVGKADTRTNKWIDERRYELPKEVLAFGATTTKTLYCGSGQSEKYYMPIFMGYPGFIDVVDKDTLELKHRVMLSSNPDIPVNYKFTHGVNSPDMKYMYIVMNDADKPHGFPSGKQHFILLDMESLEKGELKVVKHETADFPAGTITFRATYTPDGRYIYQSARTRTLVLDADTLSVVKNAPIPAGWENHDVMTTPDGKYGISALRVPVENKKGKVVKDGQIALYDMENNKYVGQPMSTCRQCHKKNEKHGPLMWGLELVGCTRCHQDERTSEDVMGNNILCGLDGVIKIK
ncbi:MAG: hypothetical protein JSV11_02820 [Nitrospiraceae bacterium]|jgi:hypothetical protein|nr:MAG: hypothetical protein JSV11_02820 [Nitrospiraceae bacterium]